MVYFINKATCYLVFNQVNFKNNLKKLIKYLKKKPKKF